MSRRLLYVAHALRPTEAEIAATPYERVEPGKNEYELDIRTPIPHDQRVAWAQGINLRRAGAWLTWLRRSFSETTFIAPWIASVYAGENDANPAHREAGLVDAEATIERCDGIVLCGTRISDGMRRERDHGLATADAGERFGCGCRSWRFDVYDLTSIDNIPAVFNQGRYAKFSFGDWYPK